MYSPRLVSTLNEIAHRYKDFVQRSLHEVLSQPQYKNTGAGLASLVVEVVEGNADRSPSILISFDDRLLFLGIRKMQWTQLPDMRNLLEWAATKKTDPKEVKRLAWSVAWNQKTKDIWKPKPWRKKGLSATLKEMNTLIVSSFDEAIEKDMQEATKI